VLIHNDAAVDCQSGLAGKLQVGRYAGTDHYQIRRQFAPILQLHSVHIPISDESLRARSNDYMNAHGFDFFLQDMAGRLV